MNKRAFWFSLITFIALIGCAVGLGYWVSKHPIKLPSTTSGVQLGYYKVVRFDDGDTLVVNMEGNQETIRMIGVDTPETKDPRKPVQCFGQAASDFTKSLIGNNPIRLEADPQNTNRDRYDRLLRYVYMPDGRLVNSEIIKHGYGFAYTSFPFGKKDEFKQYENEARESSKGLWAGCQPKLNEYGGYQSNDQN